MFSYAVASRYFSRALISGVYNNASANSGSSQSSKSSSAPATGNSLPLSLKKSTTNSLRLLTAVSGFSKRQGLDRVKSGKFGDDAYFVASDQLGDVIGK